MSTPLAYYAVYAGKAYPVVRRGRYWTVPHGPGSSWGVGEHRVQYISDVRLYVEHDGGTVERRPGGIPRGARLSVFEELMKPLTVRLG